MIEIFIPESAFQAGGPFEGQNPAKAQITVNDYSPSDGFAFTYHIKINPIQLDDIYFDSRFRGNRMMLCELVQKGFITVRHDGTDLTPQQIRDFSA